MKRQHEAVAERIARGEDPLTVYKDIYPRITSDEAARVALHRLLKREDIKSLIVTKKNQIVTQADKLAAEELKDERKFLFLSTALKRELLYRIATGKMKTKTWDTKAKEYYFAYPSDDDKIKAIKLDAELTGEGYRPPDPEPGGGITQNNTYIKRVTVFKTRITTAPAQQITTQTASE